MPNRRAFLRTFPLLLMLLACGDDATCPAGSVRLGGECVRTTDAAVSGEAGAFAACTDPPGDGGERCDGPRATDPGDAGACQGPACPAAQPPHSPTLAGAASMAPGRELWAWTIAEGSARVELRLDGKPIATPAEPRLAVALSPGSHALEARACNEAGCSDWAVHRTVAEAFGQTLPLGLVDTGRRLARTSLGHDVAVGCERCLSDADGNALAPAAAFSALERAVRTGSDLIALPVASVDGELWVSSKDLSKKDGLVRLSDALAQPPLRDGDALVLLDLVENEPRLAGSLTPAELAEALREVFRDAPLLVRNGRPMLVRASYENRAYLSALRGALTGAPEQSPYVRYVLRDPEGKLSDFYSLDARPSTAPLVPALDFVDATSFHYAAPDLPNRITLSRRAGRAVIIDGVPGTGAKHGHALISALRDQADVIITRYQPDRARQLVQLGNHELYVDGAGLSANGGTVAFAYDASSGAASRVDQPLAGIGSALAGLDSASGTLPPALAFGASNGAVLQAPRGTGGVAPGFLGALFGSFGGTLSITDGRAVVGVSGPAPDRVSLAVTTAQSADLGAFTDADASAACGANFANLLAPGTSHWLLLYADTGWHLVVDGRCAIAKPLATPLLPNAKDGAQPRILGATGAMLTAAAVLRFPTGFENDSAF